jgi:hypothetical protein
METLYMRRNALSLQCGKLFDIFEIEMPNSARREKDTSQDRHLNPAVTSQKEIMCQTFTHTCVK